MIVSVLKASLLKGYISALKQSCKALLLAVVLMLAANIALGAVHCRKLQQFSESLLLAEMARHGCGAPLETSSETGSEPLHTVITGGEQPCAFCQLSQASLFQKGLPAPIQYPAGISISPLIHVSVVPPCRAVKSRAPPLL
ncbi:MAG: hypothetical protein OEZ59_12330 [Deltaproteobacteria bacterium]|nr:hypothetical protein [Deltaproteobacteria bacterium]